MAQQTGLVRQAIDWFREKFQTLRRELISGRAGRRSSGDIIGEARRDSKIQLGHMYFFNYHPKYAAKLEYYDQFPLVIPIGAWQGGFIGMNFHYLPYNLREKLMKLLIATHISKLGERSGVKLDTPATSYLNISYDQLAPFSKYKEAKPTIHKYNMRNVASKFLHINSDEWNTALHLPVEDFRKATKSQVWLDSREKIKAL